MTDATFQLQRCTRPRGRRATRAASPARGPISAAADAAIARGELAPLLEYNAALWTDDLDHYAARLACAARAVPRARWPRGRPDAAAASASHAFSLLVHVPDSLVVLELMGPGLANARAPRPRRSSRSRRRRAADRAGRGARGGRRVLQPRVVQARAHRRQGELRDAARGREPALLRARARRARDRALGARDEPRVRGRRSDAVVEVVYVDASDEADAAAAAPSADAAAPPAAASAGGAGGAAFGVAELEAALTAAHRRGRRPRRAASTS